MSKKAYEYFVSINLKDGISLLIILQKIQAASSVAGADIFVVVRYGADINGSINVS